MCVETQTREGGTHHRGIKMCSSTSTRSPPVEHDGHDAHDTSSASVASHAEQTKTGRESSVRAPQARQTITAGTSSISSAVPARRVSKVTISQQ